MKAKYANLALSEPAPFCRVFTYRAGHPIKYMLEDGYFDTLRANFMAGDILRLVYIEGDDATGRVMERLEVTVSQVVDGVEIVPHGEVIRFVYEQAASAAEPAAPRYVTGDCTVKHKGRGKYAVMDGSGNEIAGGFGSHDEALEVATGAAPIPA